MSPTPTGPAMPGLAEFSARVAGGADRLRSVRELHAFIASLDPEAPLAVRLDRLRAGVAWLRSRAPLPTWPALDSPASDEAQPTRRLRLLVHALEELPELARRVDALVASVLAETRALALFEIGLPNQRGVGAEVTDRLARRFLPGVEETEDLAALVADLFPSLREALWLRSLPSELLARLTRGMELSRLQPALDEAIALAATRVSSLGLTREIRLRGGGSPLFESPFFRLPRACDALRGSHPKDASQSEARRDCAVLIDACRAEAAVVIEHLEEFGVSVDVVYRLEVVAQNLDRLELLLAARHASDAKPGAELLATLVAARIRDRSLRQLLHANVQLLARKIIERAGHTGEHYITRTRKEWWRMIASAGGGGVLTAGTTAMKYLVQWSGLPLFVEGFLASTNYALSFLAMQLFGFTLATKQPSMTAAALAGALKQASSDSEAIVFAPLVTQIARICRSQLAAAIGNLGLVIPAALAFDAWWRLRHGQPFFDEKAAEHTLRSLHPLESGTIPFAALTGVLLWLSSLGAGWLENWMTYRRLPDAIAEHRLGRRLGRGALRWLARRLQTGISGVGGNVTLGFLLGMLPVFGKFFGIPLEVRHVTLSTGALTLAASSTGREALSHGLLPAVAGILVIGLLNFGVSFALALGVALRARGVEHGAVRLFGAVAGRLLRAPCEFFFPPGHEADPPATTTPEPAAGGHPPDGDS